VRNDDCAAILAKETGARGVRLDITKALAGPLPDADILVNNAGINISRELAVAVSDDEWMSTLAVNLFGAFNVIRALLPKMVQKQWGRIINISSIYGFRVTSRNLPYNVSKHGLRGLTATIGKEYASDGITANEICPGPIYSALMTRISEERAAVSGGSPADYIAQLEAAIPAGRMARPADIAAVAAFLASEEAGYVTGVSIPVDGGLTL